MDNQFVRQNKKQRYLISILLVVIIITAVVVWYGFFRKETPSAVSLVTIREVNIDFDFLDSQIIKDLQPFRNILPYEDEAGRKNPFLPYGGSNVRVESSNGEIAEETPLKPLEEEPEEMLDNFEEELGI